MGENERCRRLEFLWRACHHYSELCPGLAAILGDKLLDLAGPKRLCPSCGSLLLPPAHPPGSPSHGHLTPGSARVRAVSRRKLRDLRRKKEVKWLTSPCGRARAYLLVQCSCSQVYVAAALSTATPPTLAAATSTPKSARRRKRRMTSTLKGLLQTSSQLQVQHQRQNSSPSLSLFLTELNN